MRPSLFRTKIAGAFSLNAIAIVVGNRLLDSERIQLAPFRGDCGRVFVERERNLPRRRTKTFRTEATYSTPIGDCRRVSLNAIAIIIGNSLLASGRIRISRFRWIFKSRFSFRAVAIFRANILSGFVTNPHIVLHRRFRPRPI